MTMTVRFACAAVLAAASGGADALDFKGARIGGDRSSLSVSLPQVVCAHGARVCTYYGRQVSYAGYQAKWLKVYFDGDRIVAIEAAIPAAAYPSIVSVFRGEHGEASDIFESDVKTRGGAVLRNIERRWSLSTGEAIEAVMYHGDIDTSLVLLSNADWAAVKEAIRQEEAKRAKKDM